MASSWTFGPIGVATTAGGDGVELPSHDPVQYAGDEIKIEADLTASTSADMKILRDQFRGLDDTGITIPVTSTQDATLDAYYRVVGVSVDDNPSTHFPGGLGSHLTAELERLAHAPRHVQSVFGNVRTNSHSVTIGTTIPWWAPGASAYNIDRRLVYVTGSSSATSADGAVTRLYKTSPTTYESWGSWSVEPADYYKGSSRILVSYDSGSSWRTVTGFQVRNVPTYWRMSNGLVEVTATTTASVTELSVRWYDGSQWETAKVFRLTQDSSWTDLAAAPVVLTVMHNDPHMCSVRLDLSASGTLDRRYLDVTLRRGARYLECYLSEDGTANGSGTDYGVKLTTTEAATSIITNAAWRATSNDAGGNKVVVASTQVGASDLTNGRLRVNAPPFNFMLGCVIGGGTGGGFDDTAGMVNQWLAGMEQTTSTVMV